MPINDQTEIKNLAQTCLRNIKATAEPDEFQEMMNLKVKEFNNKSVKQLFECLPEGKTNKLLLLDSFLFHGLVKNNKCKQFSAPHPCTRQEPLKKADGVQLFETALYNGEYCYELLPKHFRQFTIFIINNNFLLCLACSAHFNCTDLEDLAFLDAAQNGKWNFFGNDAAKLREVQADLMSRLMHIPKAKDVVLPGWGGTLGQFFTCKF